MKTDLELAQLLGFKRKYFLDALLKDSTYKAMVTGLKSILNEAKELHNRYVKDKSNALFTKFNFKILKYSAKVEDEKATERLKVAAAREAYLKEQYYTNFELEQKTKRVRLDSEDTAIDEIEYVPSGTQTVFIKPAECSACKLKQTKIDDLEKEIERLENLNEVYACDIAQLKRENQDLEDIVRQVRRMIQ